MHLIRIHQSHIIEAFDGPTAMITPGLVAEMYQPLDENKRRIFEATLDIEHMMQRIIEHYFFGDDEANKPRSKKFVALILTSDWCSFASKRKLVAHIIEETGALTGKAKGDYDKALLDLMSARNAFAHGRISTDGRRVKLAYFQGAPRTKFLDDDYLQSIERTIDVCWNTTTSVGVATGAYKLYEMPDDPTLPPQPRQKPPEWFTEPT